MNQKIFWIILVVVQSIGVAVVLLDAAHPIALFDYALPFAVVSLCPGLLVSTWLLDTPQLLSKDGGIVSIALVINAIFWFGVFATIREIRLKYETAIGVLMNPQRGRIRPNLLTGLVLIIAMLLLYDGLCWREWWDAIGMNLIPARITFFTLQALALGGIVLLARRLFVNKQIPPAESRPKTGSRLTKPDAGQALQAASFLLCVSLALKLTSGLDGTEFSGGWLTGPLLSMADRAIIIFVLALVITFFFPRIAATLGIASALLCLPLCCFFIAPVPFANVFARGHEFSVQQAPGFHWRMWPVTGSLSLSITLYFCIRRLSTSRTQIAQQA